VALTLFVSMVEIRMNAPWSTGVLLLVAALPAAVLIGLGLASARGDARPHAAVAVFLITGLLLAAIALLRFADLINGDETLSTGGTLTLVLALFTALAAFCWVRSGSSACLLVAALAAVALVLSAVNWIFDTDDVDVFRTLLAVSFALLFAAGVLTGGREGIVLVGAAGVTVFATAFLNGFSLFLLPFQGGGSLGWGWELVVLVQGIALLACAASWLEPGPAYLAFFALAIFVTTAAFANGVIVIGSEESPAEDLLGWPLAIGIATIVAFAWGVGQARQRG
jgi:hypothetical protein